MSFLHHLVRFFIHFEISSKDLNFRHREGDLEVVFGSKSCILDILNLRYQCFQRLINKCSLHKCVIALLIHASSDMSDTASTTS